MVLGTCCATYSQWNTPTPIFEVNILPYRQPCCECGRELVMANANFPVLFDGGGICGGLSSGLQKSRRAP